MNDHIKRCILDAGFPKFDKMYVVSDGEELEKFAQLIVNDIAEYFGREGEGRFEVDGNWIAKTIRQQFGVEK